MKRDEEQSVDPNLLIDVFRAGQGQNDGLEDVGDLGPACSAYSPCTKLPENKKLTSFRSSHPSSIEPKASVLGSR